MVIEGIIQLSKLWGTTFRMPSTSASYLQPHHAVELATAREGARKASTSTRGRAASERKRYRLCSEGSSFDFIWVSWIYKQLIRLLDQMKLLDIEIIQQLMR